RKRCATAEQLRAGRRLALVHVRGQGIGRRDVGGTRHGRGSEREMDGKTRVTTVVSRQSSVGSCKSTVVGQQSTVVVCALVIAGSMFAAQIVAAPKYDLLLQGGHVIDPRND